MRQLSRKFVVCGLPRTGTTILQVYLNSVPGMLCLSEPHREWMTFKTTSFFNGLPVSGLTYDEHNQLPLNKAMNRLLKRYFAVGFKTVFTPDSEREMMRRYHDSGYRFIYIVRDPVETLNSIRCHNQNHPDESLRKYGVDRLMREYLDFLAFASCQRADCITYRGFVADPEKTVLRLGLPVPEKIVVREKSCCGDSRAQEGGAIKLRELPALVSDDEAAHIRGSDLWNIWEELKAALGE